MPVMLALAAVVIVVGVVGGLWLLGFANRLLRGEEAADAAADSAGQTAVYVGAGVGVVGMALITFGDLVDVLLNAVAASPVVIGNFLVGLLGAIGIAGLVELSLVSYVILAVAITGFVLIVRRARTA